jgi:protocatechuate 3,4-dioxygenase beta subunit
MLRIAKWAAPVVALGLMLGLAIKVKAEEAKATGTVSGTVVDKDGKPVANASVGVFTADMAHKHQADKKAEGAETDKNKAGKEKGEKAKPVAEATTDSEGKYTIKDVPAGDYVVRVNVKGQGRAVQKVTVKAGESTTADLKLGETKKPKAA